ncbi:hypothetical protein DFH08DRAFT_968727 [Mycena albidolilacea]|uniref:Uncharacterized protein n=1 Tax=Mycena albidolilacea TaxID=1033008 RepID=A0AAD6ZJ27_9AGAR|nr:hypothetical protein DFH08DRAFT_968727 [Mycena albidolilacea]
MPLDLERRPPAPASSRPTRVSLTSSTLSPLPYNFLPRSRGCFRVDMRPLLALVRTSGIAAAHGVVLPALITFFTRLCVSLPWPCLRIARPPVRDVQLETIKQKQTRRTPIAPTEEFDAADQDGSELYCYFKKVELATSLPPTSSFPIPLLLGQARPARRLAPSARACTSSLRLTSSEAVFSTAPPPRSRSRQISSDIDPSLQHILHHEPKPEPAVHWLRRGLPAGESAGGDGYTASATALGECEAWRCVRMEARPPRTLTLTHYAMYGEARFPRGRAHAVVHEEAETLLEVRRRNMTVRASRPALPILFLLMLSLLLLPIFVRNTCLVGGERVGVEDELGYLVARCCPASARFTHLCHCGVHTPTAPRPP